MGKRAVVLRNARELISDPTRWTKGAFARDREGTAVPVSLQSAQSFCAMGACMKALRERGQERFMPGLLLDKAAILLSGGQSLTYNYNDHETRTHDEVLWLFDLAIALTEVGE